MQDVDLANLIAELSLGRHRTWLTGSENASITEVHRSLVVHALFGHLFYLSDRFMLTNSAALKLMLDEDSLLREMLWTNFAQIVTIANNQQEFINQAETLETSSKADHIIETWKIIAKSKWEVAVRMPRSRLAVGFEDRTKYNQQDDPRVVEFKEYSSEMFGALTSDATVSHFSSGLEHQKKAISNQFTKYKSNQVAQFLERISYFEETPVTNLGKRQQNLLLPAYSEIELLAHPIIAICPESLHSNLSVFKSIAHPDNNSVKQKKIAYSKLVHTLIEQDSHACKSVIADEINHHTEDFLNEFKSLSQIVKQPECAQDNWIKVCLRDILPSVISAAGI